MTYEDKERPSCKLPKPSPVSSAPTAVIVVRIPSPLSKAMSLLDFSAIEDIVVALVNAPVYCTRSNAAFYFPLLAPYELQSTLAFAGLAREASMNIRRSLGSLRRKARTPKWTGGGRRYRRTWSKFFCYWSERIMYGLACRVSFPRWGIRMN